MPNIQILIRILIYEQLLCNKLKSSCRVDQFQRLGSWVGLSWYRRWWTYNNFGCVGRGWMSWWLTHLATMTTAGGAFRISMPWLSRPLINTGSMEKLCTSKSKRVCAHGWSMCVHRNITSANSRLIDSSIPLFWHARTSKRKHTD